MSAVTDEIKARVDLVELIGRTVSLKRSGSSYRGLCPFHQEKTPSFYVFPHSHTWVCFGCGKKGSAFDWLIEREHLDFGEALRTLAQQTGVALPERRDPEQEETSQRLYNLLERAQTYYQGVLWGSAGAAGRAYLASRDVHDETARAFGLGFAPPGGGLLRYLQGDGFSEDELIASGVAGQADDGRLYDFFRDRILFPIRDPQGRTVAFGGRVLDAGTPKYLNSRDTLLFHKQETLFAFDLARRPIAQERQAIIVEGYMDALRAHQHSYRNVVATLGTAVTDRHLRLLRRSVETVVLALDADAAGQTATWRALQVAEQSLRSGLTPVVGPSRRQRRYVPDQPVRLLVMALPGAKDPDDLIRADPGSWPGLVRAAQPVIDFVLDRLADRYDLASAQGKAAAADEVTEILAAIADPIEQAHYVQQVADLLGVGQDAVQRVLRRKRSGVDPKPSQSPPSAPPEQDEGDKDDEYLLALVLRLRDLNVPLESREVDFVRDESRALLRALLAGQQPSDELRPSLERAQARVPKVEGFSREQLITELALSRLWLEQRALQRRQLELNTAMKQAPPAEQDEMVDGVITIGRRLAEIEQERLKLQLGRRAMEAA